MSTYSLPKLPAVIGLFEMMLGRKVKVAPLKNVPALQDQFVGLYRDDENTIRAACHVDLRLAASCSAALSLFPPGAVDECVDGGQLSPHLSGNLHEVLNICVGLFNAGDVPRIRLDGIVLVGEPSDDLNEFLAANPSTSDMRIEVAGYGLGQLRMSCV